MTEYVKRREDAGVLTLTLDRVDKKNALNNAMYGALADGLEIAETEPSIKVVLIDAEGDMFTSGNDLAEFATAAAGAPSGDRHVTRFLRNLAGAETPIVAAVQGRAVGVGTTMLLHCDLVYLADNALLSTPFVGLGLVPEAGSSLLIPARIGHVRAFEIFALGEPIDADSARAWGLANGVLPLADLHTAAQAACRRLATQPAGAVRATKSLMRHAPGLAEHMDLEGRLFAERLTSAEAREAFEAFAQRRAPNFSNPQS